MSALTSEHKAFAVGLLEQVVRSRGLTQTQLQALSDVPQSQISKIRNQQVQPTEEVLRKLFEAVGLKLEDALHEAPVASGELVGYLATPLTGLDPQAEAERDRVVKLVRSVAGREAFSEPKIRLYWPGDYTHPSRNQDWTAEQVYLLDRSRASAYDFIILFCASPSFGVGQENEIATQAGLPAIRLIPHGLSRMMLGSFIGATDVPYTGDLRVGIQLGEEALFTALVEVRKTYFRHQAVHRGINGNDFGKRLEGLVNQRCEGNQAFAHDLGVSLGYALRLMSEPLIVSNPSARLLQRMSRILGVSVGFLLGENGPSDAIVSESHASWRKWVESTPGLEAAIANRLWDNRVDGDSRSKKEPQLASLRSQPRKAMALADWDALYQRSRKAEARGDRQKGLF